MKAKKNFQNKTKGYIYPLLDYNPKIINKDKLIKNLVSNIRETSIGFAGFKNKKNFQKYLQFHLFDEKEYKEIPKYNFDKKQIIQIIQETLFKCQKELPSKPTWVFVFPNFKKFVKNKMGGLSGYSPCKNTIWIEINPSVKNWEKSLKNTVCHEYNHSVVYNFHKWETLLDCLIFEGLAEHFREKIIEGEKPNWVKAVSKKDCKKYFNLLKDDLNSKDQEVEIDVFFKNEKYPLWLGYSLGYQITEEYLNKNKDKSWKEIIKKKPKEILKESNF